MLEPTDLLGFIGHHPSGERNVFVVTGDDLGDDRLPLESSRSGVFAVGDVRACSVKRVAASVGDGAQVVAAIHAYLGREHEAPEPQVSVQPAAATA